MIDKKGGGIGEIPAQDVCERRERGNGLQGSVHMTQPGFAFGGADLERHMPHPQTRMPSFFLIAQRASEALDQEPSQVLLGLCQVCRVKRTQKGVRLNPPIKGFDESVKGLIIAEPGVYLGRLVIHNQMGVRPLKRRTSGAVYPLFLD